MDYDIGIVRRRRIISPDECYFTVPAPTGFLLPGDIVPTGWLYWGGMRAFKLGLVTPAVDILFNDSVVLTYSTLAGGTVDFSTFATAALIPT